VSTWVWIVIVAAVVVVLLLAAAAGMRARRRRSEMLQRRFGPEYDRTLAQTGNRTAAEEELAERKRRRDELELRPLAPAARQSFMDAWRADQAAFVDDPARAIAEADGLIQTVMRERGYPVERFEDRASIVSVDHPLVVERYRRAHAITVTNADGNASTEQLRRAMQDYRALFDELVEASDEGDPRDTTGATAPSQRAVSQRADSDITR
jgi:hypothetical protein